MPAADGEVELPLILTLVGRVVDETDRHAQPPVVVGRGGGEGRRTAAEALAQLVAHPTADMVIPSPFDSRVVAAVAQVIR